MIEPDLERCALCRQWYQRPVGHNHDGNECLRNQLVRDWTLEEAAQVVEKWDALSAAEIRELMFDPGRCK